MKITNIRTVMMDACYRGFNIDYLHILVETDEGITGLGEGTNWPGCPMVNTAIDELKPFLIGADPLDIESICHHLNKRFHYIGIAGVLPSAISGVEIALWDIAGKKAGLPVYKLLGGKAQPEIKVYANYWSPPPKDSVPLDEFATKALEVVAMGYKAMKYTPFSLPPMMSTTGSVPWSEIAKGVKRVAAVREAVGDDIEIYLELAGKFDVPTAIKVARTLEPYRIGFIEEPIPPENIAAMVEVRRKSPCPVAAGERVYGRFGFLPYLEAGALDILQPDVMRTGGIWELRKIAALAETYHLPIAPHNAGGAVGTIATLHAALAMPNFEILEYRIGDVPWRDTVIRPQIEIKNGIMTVPDAPGLGIEFVEEVALEHPHIPVTGAQ